MPATVLDLLRHGEPVGGRCYRGNGVDDPLSEAGWAQMQAAVEAAPDSWTRVVTSPLSRCRAFAAALGERLGIPLDVEADLREVGFGVWEGLTPERVAARYPQMLAAFRADPVGRRPEGAEPAQAFFDRSVRALEAIARRHPGERLLIVAHAGTLRAATAWAVQAPLAEVFRIKVGYAARVRLRYEAGRPWLELG
ncbi:MAG: histidine phosphatase family protein [Gammaproteobacteria bacterium]|nr:histidine phosphatase family protein [Gammaproteobacteria bacterium]MDX5374227.1 histidine phosphatase family protein [Gammaproteobacteria bacterium]